MNILDVAFVEELVDACQYFWEAGWEISAIFFQMMNLIS